MVDEGYDKETRLTKYAAIVRSTYALVRSRSTPTSKAEALSGVQVTVTAEGFDPDLNRRKVTLADLCSHQLIENCLAMRTHFTKGHAIAAVAADHPAIAEQAPTLMDVDYEPLSLGSRFMVPCESVSPALR